MVAIAVPGRQVVQVVAEGVELGHEVGVEHMVDVLYAHGFLFRQVLPQRVDDAVGDGTPEHRRLFLGT